MILTFPNSTQNCIKILIEAKEGKESVGSMNLGKGSMNALSICIHPHYITFKTILLLIN